MKQKKQSATKILFEKMDTDDLFKLTAVLTQYYFISLLHCFSPFSPVILIVSECPLLNFFVVVVLQMWLSNVIT